MSTSTLKSIAHVRVMSDPTGRTGMGLLLQKCTLEVSGTAIIKAIHYIVQVV